MSVHGGRCLMNLSLNKITDVVMLPAVPVPDTAEGFLVGTYSLDGHLIPGFEFRRPKSIAKSPPFQRARSRLRGSYLYGGLLIEHFGHFLIESLSRTWALTAHKQLPVVWQCFPKPKLVKWQIEIFKILGIDHRHFRLISRPSKVDTVILPDAGFILNDFVHPDQAEALAAFPFRAPLSGKRIWLSKSKLPPDKGKVLNEEEIEARLLARGWSILHPERVSVSEQLGILSDAETVAGFAGSAFHLLVLGKEVQTKVRIVRRYANPLPATFEIVARAKRLDQRILNIDFESDNGLRDTRAIVRVANRQEIDRIVDEVNL
jgi:hypothetical protein